MVTLRRYLGALFLQRWIVTTMAMLILVSLLDALGNADLLPEGAGFVERLRYMMLRAPIIYDRIFLFALMLAVLLTFLSLIRRDELVAISAAGVSAFAQLRALAPAVMLATLASILLIDQAAPRTMRELNAWLGADAFRDAEEIGSNLWLTDGNLIVEIERVREDSLSGIIFYERGANDTVTAVHRAEEALHAGTGWLLSGVKTTRFDGRAPEPPLVWDTPQSPQTLLKLRSAPRDLSLRDLFQLAEMRGSGSLPSSAYRVWALHRLTLPLAAFAFLTVAVALMQRLGRRDTGDGAMIAGLLIGFAFLIIDGVFKTMAEAGGMSAGIGVGVPLAGLLALGLHLLLSREHAP